MPEDVPPTPRRKLHPSTVLVGGIVLLFVIIFSITSGLTGFLTALFFTALFTGGYVVLTGRRSWARLPARRYGVAVLGVGLVAMILIGVVAPTPRLHSADTTSTAEAPVTRAPSPVATFSADSPADPSTVTTTSLSASVVVSSASATSANAADLLARLPIKPALTSAGYHRTADFGTAWLDIDRNGCDTRNDILARDLTGISRSGSCRVTAGTLVSPYTGATIDFVRGEKTSALVQIDHIVALGDAWETGAQSLTQAQRVTLANDPLELTAVDGRSNDQKGDKDAASWLPANVAFDCIYVARQISVKVTYALWVTRAEHDAMAKVLASCGAITGTASQFALVSPAPPAPAPAAPAPAAPAPAAPGVVHPGTFCSTVGAPGVTSAGTAMMCKTSATDTRLRWRAA